MPDSGNISAASVQNSTQPFGDSKETFTYNMRNSVTRMFFMIIKYIRKNGFSLGKWKKRKSNY